MPRRTRLEVLGSWALTTLGSEGNAIFGVVEDKMCIEFVISLCFRASQLNSITLLQIALAECFHSGSSIRRAAQVATYAALKTRTLPYAKHRRANFTGPFSLDKVRRIIAHA